MRTAIYVQSSTTVTVRTSDDADRSVQLHRYQGRLPPRPAVGTFDIPAGIYLIASRGPVQVTGANVRKEVAIIDKDPWPEPPAQVVALETGATRQQANAYFFAAIQHYASAGDTALHLAAAAHDCEVAERLLGCG